MDNDVALGEIFSTEHLFEWLMMIAAETESFHYECINIGHKMSGIFRKKSKI